MAIHTICPHCQDPGTCSDASAGKTVRCGCCQQLFTAIPSDAKVRPPRQAHSSPRQSDNPRLWVMTAVIGLVALVAASAFGVLYGLGFIGPHVTLSNFEQLKVGMSEREVRRVLGTPRRVDRTGVPRHLSGVRQYELDKYPRRLFWEDGDDIIWVTVQNGEVQDLGAFLEGERYGKEPQERLSDELPKKDATKSNSDRPHVGPQLLHPD
jgi:hypothetical protein